MMLEVHVAEAMTITTYIEYWHQYYWIEEISSTPSMPKYSAYKIFLKLSWVNFVRIYFKNHQHLKSKISNI
jgi:hypothetical protein